MILPQIDIHNHLLPAVDDGFQKADDSYKAIRRMIDAGCHEFVFTPHMNPDVNPDVNEAMLKSAYDAFSKGLPLGIKTHLAAEYMVVDNFESRLENPSSLLLQPDGSILIEMSYYFRSLNLENVIFQLSLQGIRPILAHPERYVYMADCLKDFDKLRDMGCCFQMNLMSLTGCYGKSSVAIMKYLVGNGFYDFKASDLHTLGQLDSILSIEKEGVLSKRSFLDKLLGR